MASGLKRKSRITNAESSVDVSLVDAETPCSEAKNHPQPPQKKQKNVKDTDLKSHLTVEILFNKEDRPPPSLRTLHLDIFYEICQYLEPLDVFHLSRTSVQLYVTLTNWDVTTALWRKSRSLMPYLPDCPRDLTEGQYARLMFVNECFVCGDTRVKELHTSWSARLRACISCLKSKRFTASRDIDGIPSSLERFLPKFTCLIITGSRLDCTLYFFYPKISRTWKRQYAAAKDKCKWLEEKVNKRKAIEKHGNECMMWAIEWESSKPRRRQARVVERIKALGWGRELSMIQYDDYKPQNTKIITKACSKELTERDLLKLEPYINEYMSDVQQKRIKHTKGLLIQDVVRILSDIITACKPAFPPNEPVPTAGDLIYLPIVQDLITDIPIYDRVNPTTELEVLRQTFPDITAQWRHNVQTTLIGLIKSTYGHDYEIDPQTVLHLATTAFSCKMCSKRHKDGGFVWYPGVIAHSHASIQVNYTELNESKEKRSIGWNDDGPIIFRRDVMLSLSKVLTQFGFDSKVITPEQMDAANIVFECISCNHQKLGRLTMRWRILASHISESHCQPDSPPLKLEVLEGSEAECVRNGLDQKTSRIRVKCRRVKGYYYLPTPRSALIKQRGQ